MNNNVKSDDEYPLFTMGIPAYENYRYLRETIDSILSQTYPNIEIIISNDGSSDFDEKEIREYIDQNKQVNIKNIFIRNHKENLGTVKNVNYICNKAQGEYIIFIAADDVLDHDTVIEQFVSSFQNENKEAYAVCGKTAMCGKNISKIKGYIPNQYHIDLIKTKDCSKLFSKLACNMFIPTTSKCYRRELFEKIGLHDENCQIMEDYPFALKMALEGYHVGWIDNFVAARHRGGGISLGNRRGSSETLRRYRFDEVYTYMTYSLPNMHLLSSEDRNYLRNKWQYVLGAYIHDFLFPEGGFGADYRDYDEELCQKIVKHREGKRKKERITDFCDISVRVPLLRIMQLLLGIWLVEFAMVFAMSIQSDGIMFSVTESQNILWILSRVLTVVMCVGIGWYTIRIVLKIVYAVYHSYFERDEVFWG